MIFIEIFFAAGLILGLAGICFMLNDIYQAVKFRKFRNLVWGAVSLAAGYGSFALAADISASV